jgi:hypothetical protein
MPRNDLIQIRQGTQAQWSSINPILASGEAGYANDTKVLKIGDGINAWNSLFDNIVIGTGSDGYVPLWNNSKLINSNIIQTAGSLSNITTSSTNLNVKTSGNISFADSTFHF